MKDQYKFLIVVGVFVAAYFIPFGDVRVRKAILEAFYMIQDYAQKHVLLCLVPAFFIAGAITVFVSEASVMKYLGPLANKFLAYSVASVSGTILAVCSCTVLPLFAGIYRMGAGLGPATAFLYSGPAINILAIVLSAKVLGWQIGLARAVGSVGFAYVIGLAMAFIFRDREKEDPDGNACRRTAASPLAGDRLHGLYDRCPRLCKLGKARCHRGVLVCHIHHQVVHNGRFWPSVHVYLCEMAQGKVLGVVSRGPCSGPSCGPFPKVSTSLILCRHRLSRLRRQNLFC
jgi:uncharacterized membrane protein YraQ (UPF0718 family)